MLISQWNEPKSFNFKGSLACWLVVFIICGFAVFIQSNLLLNWDVSWLTHAAERSLAGGTYSQNFFDGDPPVILYLYMVSILISKIFSLSIIISSRIFVFGLGLVSLFICNFFLSKILDKRDQVLNYLLLMMIAVVFFVLPMQEFGQREHLMLMLIFPYLLLTVLRTQDLSVNKWVALSVGVLAGIGFSIKPFFFITLIFVELYLLVQKRTLLTLFRIELVAIVIFNLLYLLDIFLFYSDLVYVIYPIIFKIYYGGYIDYKITTLVLTAEFVFCFFAMMLGFCFGVFSRYKDIFYVFSLATLGFLISYLYQRLPVYYHFYPVWGMGIIILFLIFCLMIKDSLIKYGLGFNLVNLFFIGTAFFIFPLVGTYHIYLTWSEAKLIPNEIIPIAEKYSSPLEIYFISSNYMPYPLVDYANLKVSSRFFNEWWLSGLIKKEKMASTSAELEWVQQNKKYFIDTISFELDTLQPLLVLVDDKIGYNQDKFDYISYFSQNDKFRQSWKKYQFLYNLSYFKVYQRLR